jgi:hypothetical protein
MQLLDHQQRLLGLSISDESADKLYVLLPLTQVTVVFQYDV